MQPEPIKHEVRELDWALHFGEQLLQLVAECQTLLVMLSNPTQVAALAFGVAWDFLHRLHEPLVSALGVLGFKDHAVDTEATHRAPVAGNVERFRDFLLDERFKLLGDFFLAQTTGFTRSFCVVVADEVPELQRCVHVGLHVAHHFFDQVEFFQVGFTLLVHSESSSAARICFDDSATDLVGASTMSPRASAASDVCRTFTILLIVRVCGTIVPSS
ncbi:hypothetical protein D3C71_1214130 [compost metagenome]